MTVTLEHEKPVDLAKLSMSFFALAAQHNRYSERIGATINGDEVRLYVREIRSGSIVAELVALSQTTAPPILGAVNTIVSFAKSVRDALRYFTGEQTALPDGITPKDARDLSSFVQPVADDSGAKLTITAKDNAKVNVVQIVVNSNDANAAQNRIGNWVAQHVEPLAGRQFQRLFYFFQAREGAKKTGDMGIIESISQKPVKTIFANEPAKEAMLGEALFRKLYVVDVDVETVGGKPRLYKILNVHESMDRSEAG